ncbi:MAG: response regulator [Anaerolinea sp.]|nr:response regulator [Anaerolinea sp.]
MQSVSFAEETRVKSVLIADDNFDLRVLFSAMFRRRGYDVRLVSDGREALAALETLVPDVLVLDVNMPNVSGLEVLRSVRASEVHKKVYVIIVSGNTMVERMPEAQFADLLLIKPVSPIDLVTLAERLTS